MKVIAMAIWTVVMTFFTLLMVAPIQAQEAMLGGQNRNPA